MISFRARVRGSLSALVTCGVLVLAACVAPMAPEAARPFRVGGPCRYDVSMGTAQLLAVRPASGSVEMDLTLSMPASFKPAAWWHENQIRASVVGPPGVPDARWLVRNGIVVGATYPVELSVIREGTCTPVLLRFPGRAWVVE